MDAPRPVYDEPADLWNGAAGQVWVEQQALLDTMFQGLEDRLVAEVLRKKPRSVLDVGCGTGSTTMAIAGAVAGGACLGIDVSEPMIAAACRRAEAAGSAARFICADAQTYPFDSGRFDMIVSRFGVMFFGAPVAAFANLRSASSIDGELRMLAWRAPEENGFMITAERAAAPLLARVPQRPVDGPGQFAFADDRHVRGILEGSGWHNVDLDPVDIACRFPRRDLTRYLTRLGPLGLLLRNEDEETQARVVEGILPSFAPFIHGEEVRFTAACWLICADASERRAADA